MIWAVEGNSKERHFISISHGLFSVKYEGKISQDNQPYSCFLYPTCLPNVHSHVESKSISYTLHVPCPGNLESSPCPITRSKKYSNGQLKITI